MSESKLDAYLSAMVKEKSAEEEVPVILTLSEDISLEAASQRVTKLGLKVQSVLGGPEVGLREEEGGPIPVITGSIRIGNLPRLSAASEVTKIEHDSKVYAQETSSS